MADVPVVEFYMIGPELPSEQNPQDLAEVERLLKEFETHESQEGEFLQQYKDICGRVENPIIKFLLQLIIADEEKHHAITHAMAATLKGDLNWTKPKDALRGLYALGAEKTRSSK
jgi:rubrerythrin